MDAQLNFNEKSKSGSHRLTSAFDERHQLSLEKTIPQPCQPEKRETEVGVAKKETEIEREGLMKAQPRGANES